MNYALASFEYFLALDQLRTAHSKKSITSNFDFRFSSRRQNLRRTAESCHFLIIWRRHFRRLGIETKCTLRVIKLKLEVDVE